MKYFANIKTLDELKAQYRRLAMQYHPDRGGSTEIMQQINAEYERLHERFEPLHPHHQKTPESLMIWAFAFSKVPTEVPTFI